MSVMEVLGNKLKVLRQNMGLSQKDAAKKLNIGGSTLSNYENGFSQPDYEMLKALSTFYTVPIDYLLDFDFRETKNSPETVELFNKISMLKTEDRMLVKIMVEGMLERAEQRANMDVQKKKEA